MAGREFTEEQLEQLINSEYPSAWADAFDSPLISNYQLYILGLKMYPSSDGNPYLINKFEEVFENRLREYHGDAGLLKYFEELTSHHFEELTSHQPELKSNEESELEHFRLFENRFKRIVADIGRDEDLNILVNDPDMWIRIAVAKHRRPEDLGILRNDPVSSVRFEIAKQGRPEDLGILRNDPSLDVRAAVAEYGRPQDLFLLKYDEELEVTLMNVARDKHISNESLDELVTCPLPSVREAVAEQGRPKDLDILRNDPDEFVRKAVAEYGRPEDLDFLRDDPDEDVRYAVQKMENSDLASMAEEATKQREVSNPEPESSNHDKDGR